MDDRTRQILPFARWLGCVAAAAALVWCVAAMFARLLRVEGMVRVDYCVQPGARLPVVENCLAAKARTYNGGSTPYEGFPISVGPEQAIATFDSYQLDALGDGMDFWVLLDADRRVVSKGVKAYPPGWPAKPPP